MSLANALRQAPTHKDGPRWFRRNKRKYLNALVQIKAKPPALFFQMLVHAGWAHVISDSEVQEPASVLAGEAPAPLASDLDSHALYSHTAPGL